MANDQPSNLQKTSEGCPTLSDQRLTGSLVGGRIPREEAVLVWDFGPDGGAPVTNVAVGFMPPSLPALPRDDPSRASWREWTRLWNNFHGLPVVGGELATGGATPEGIVASWVDQGLEGAELDAIVADLSSSIHGFSRARVDDFVEQLRERRED